MDCLLPLIAGLCLANPSTLSVRAEAQYLANRSGFYHLNSGPYNGALGRLELRVDSAEFHGIRVTYVVGHQSFIETNRDRGYEYVGAGLVWRPFR